MPLILIFLPYFIVPLLITLFFKWFLPSWKWFAFFPTAIIIYYYPLGLFWFENYLNPPSSDLGRCFNPEAAFFFINITLFLPLSLIVQLVFIHVLILPQKGKTT
jgi:hypothetical protein